MARRQARGGPSGSAVLAGMRRELEDGWPAGLTLLTGGDRFHLDRAQRELIAALVPAEGADFALTIFADEKVGVGTVVGAARSAAMFAPRRVVLVRDVALLDGEPDALVEYGETPPAESFLIVRAPELDQRRKLHKALLGSGRVLSFPAVEPDAADGEARRLAKEKGLKIDGDAARFLAEVCGGDLYRLDAELEKIAAWLGPGAETHVTLDVAKEVAAGSELLSGWEIADAVLRRDRGAALAAAGRLIAAGDEPIRLVGGLAWRARTMLQAKALLDRGAPRRQVASAVRGAWNILDSLGGFSLDELLRFPARLLAADRALKSSSIDGQTVLARLIDDMIGPPRAHGRRPGPRTHPRPRGAR